MKVLYIHASGNHLVGSELVLLNMLDHLDSRIQKTILLPESGIFHERLIMSGHTTEVFPFSPFSRNTPWSYFKHLLDLVKMIRKLKPDLIHTSSASPVQYAYPLSKLFGIPLICHIQCPYQHDDMRRYFPYRADRVVLISQFLNQTFAAKYQNKLRLIYSGIEIPNLSREQCRQSILRHLQLPEDTLLIGMVGQIIPRKGIDTFIRSISSISSLSSKVHFLIVGDHHNAYGQKMEKLATQLGISDRLSWAGYQDDSQHWMAGMEALVVPSRSEGFGLVAAEAMAVGTPVIASKIGGLPEIVDHQRNGFLIPPADVQALEHKLHWLLTNRSHWSEMSLNGQKKIREQFSIQASVNAIQQLYAELVPCYEPIPAALSQ